MCPEQEKIDLVTVVLSIVAVIAISAMLLLGGCAGKHTVQEAGWTPDMYDAWQDVMTCWQETAKERPTVIVRTDCVPSPSGAQHYRIGSVAGQDRWAYGQTDGSVVQVCPDLSALRHEFSHYVSGKGHGEGCWL